MNAISARDFGYDQEPRQPLIPQQRRIPTSQLRLETPAASTESGWGHYQRSLDSEQIGLAIGPQAPRSVRDDHSPITPASNRTRNSQLLPDKPSYSLFPPPARLAPRNSIPSQSIRPSRTSPRPAVPPLGSPFARQTPQHPSAVDTSQAHLQGGSVAAGFVADPFTDSTSRSPPHVYPNFRESQPRLPPVRDNLRRSRLPSWEQPPVVRKPVPTYQPYRAERTGPVPQQAIDRRGDAAMAHKRKPSRKSSAASKRTTIFSIRSDTSFEDGDDEAQVKSGLIRRPGRVSYPAIPVSAAESPTRRPQEQPANPTQPDSLLSKRLGQDKAKEIASRLRTPPGGSEDNNGKTLLSPPVKSPQTPWRR